MDAGRDRRDPRRPARPDRGEPCHAPPGRRWRIRLPGDARGTRAGGRIAEGRAHDRPAHAARRTRGRSRTAGRPGRLRCGVRRPCLPPHAAGLRWPRGADRDAGGAGRRRRDRLGAPARGPSSLEPGRDRGVPRRSSAAGGASVVHNRWHPDLEPIAEVGVDEEVRLETADGLAGQLTRASSHADAGALDLGLAHPLTGPLFVRAAEPGDVLEVEFLEYESADFGITAAIPGFVYLADLFPDPYVVKWEIAEGLARSRELPGVAVPEETFAGVVGVAPSPALLEQFRAREEALRGQGQAVADPLPGAAAPPEAADGLRTIPPRETGGEPGNPPPRRRRPPSLPARPARAS